MATSPEDVKALGRNALVHTLESIANERRMNRAERAFPLVLRAGSFSGLPMTGMTASSGLSRTSVYEFVRREPADDLAADEIHLVLLAVLAAAGPQTTDALAGGLGVATSTLHTVLAVLAEEGLARFVGSSGAPDDTGSSVWAISDGGEDWLEDRTRHQRWRHQDRVAVYFILEDASEIPALSAAVEAILGREYFAIVKPGTGRSTHELALAIVATDDRRETILQAYDIWAEARDNAGLKPRLPRVIDVSWPTRRAGS